MTHTDRSSSVHTKLAPEPKDSIDIINGLCKNKYNALKLHNHDGRAFYASDDFSQAEAIEDMNDRLQRRGLSLLTEAAEKAVFAICSAVTGIERFNNVTQAGKKSFRWHDYAVLPVTGRLLERDRTKAKTLEAVTSIAQWSCQSTTPDKLPLIATVGPGGSGKTTYCRAIRHGIGGENWGAEIDRAIKECCPNAKFEASIILMASFGEESAYNCLEKGNALQGLTHRGYLDFVQARLFDPSNTKRLPDELKTLEDFLSTIRGLKAAELAIEDANRVPVILLVDELMKVGSEVSGLLGELAERQLAEVCRGTLFIPIVTSLRVDVFAQLTKESQWPVTTVPLEPLTVNDGLRVVEQALIAKHVPLHPLSAAEVAFNIKVAVAQTGGHPRTVEKLFSPKAGFMQPFRFPSLACERYRLATVALLLKLLVDPTRQFTMSETIHSELTVADLAAYRIVVFTDVDAQHQTTGLKVIPHELHFTDYPWVSEFQREFELLHRLMESATRFENLHNRTQVIISLALEIKAGALLRIRNSIGFDELFTATDAFIQHSANYQQLLVRPDIEHQSIGATFSSVKKIDAKSQVVKSGLGVFLPSSRVLKRSVYFNLLQAKELNGIVEDVTVACQIRVEKVARRWSKVVRLVDEIRSKMCTKGGGARSTYVMVVSATSPRGCPVPESLPEGTILLGPCASAELHQHFGLGDVFVSSRSIQLAIAEFIPSDV